jgi:hypothetical protein
MPKLRMFQHFPQASAEEQSQRKRVLQPEVLGASIGETCVPTQIASLGISFFPPFNPLIDFGRIELTRLN